MDTGLFFGLRFYEHEDGEPELSYNRDECKDFVHKEYVCLPEKKLIPFGFKIKGEGVGFSPGSVNVRLFCEGQDLGLILTELSDWRSFVYNGYTYIYYYGNNQVNFQSNVQPGNYRLKITFDAAGVKRYYSDIFRVNHFIMGEFDFYTATFEVVEAMAETTPTPTPSGDLHGDMYATVGGIPIASGSEHMSGTTIEFTAVPDAGYRVKSWRVNGEERATVGNSFSWNIYDNIHVTVSFEVMENVYSKEYSGQYI